MVSIVTNSEECMADVPHNSEKLFFIKENIQLTISRKMIKRLTFINKLK